MAAQIYLPPPSCLGMRMVGSTYPFAAGSSRSSSTQPIVGRLSSRVGHQASRPQPRTSPLHPWASYLTHAATYFLSPTFTCHEHPQPRLFTIHVHPHSLVNNRPTLPHATVLSLTDARVGTGDDGSGSHLGDDEPAETRLASLRDEVARKLEVYGAVGPHRPKNMLDFCRNVAYKKTDGQQLEAACIWLAPVLAV